MSGSNCTGDDPHGMVKFRVNFVATCASCTYRGAVFDHTSAIGDIRKTSALLHQFEPASFAKFGFSLVFKIDKFAQQFMKLQNYCTFQALYENHCTLREIIS